MRTADLQHFMMKPWKLMMKIQAQQYYQEKDTKDDTLDFISFLTVLFLKGLQC